MYARKINKSPYILITHKNIGIINEDIALTEGLTFRYKMIELVEFSGSWIYKQIKLNHSDSENSVQILFKALVYTLKKIQQ